MDYKSAGVDVEAGRAFIDRIRQGVESTRRPGVLGGLGGFGGYFQIPSGYKEPVLVSGTDGVGTKLKIAQAVECHDSIGIDLVAMCVNDILTSGAEPLFFLDYLATGKLKQEQLAQVVAGIVEGCRQSGCALLGGETAEMPGFYQPNEYDVAGFSVGIVEKSQLLDGSKVAIGDIAVGLASSGLHSNGYSLIRKIIEEHKLHWSDKIIGEQTLADICLTPTKIYVKSVLSFLNSELKVKAMAHITGGGLPENLPRCLAENQSIKIDPHSWPILPVFNFFAKVGNIALKDMFNTFNMGIGFVLIVSPTDLDQTIAWFKAEEIEAYKIGEVVKGDRNLIGL